MEIGGMANNDARDVGVMLQEPESGERRERGLGCWRCLPTAWIHFIFAECVHMTAAGYAWRRLINTINTNCAMKSYYVTTGKIENYFASLYFLGAAEEIDLTLGNVTDDFFLGEGDVIHFTPSLLRVPSTTLQGGVNIMWLIVAWSFPVMLAAILAYMLIGMARLSIWSFDSTAYLNYTLHLYRKPMYQLLVKLMIVPPVVLPAMWIVQMAMFQLWDQVAVFRSETVSGILLVWGIYGLAHPQPSAHKWTKKHRIH